MIKLAIVEDDKEQMTEIEKLVCRFFKENNDENYTIDTYSSGNDLLNNYVDQYSIILLDIGMPGMNGMDTAGELRKRNSTACIIFMTNMPKYAINGYEVEAIGFLVKPVKYFGLCNCLRKALLLISQQDDVKILVTTRQGVISIPSSRLLYVESQLHDINYVTDTVTVRQRGSVKEVEEKLEGHNFSRCNNSYLVNLKFVNSIYNNTVTIMGHTLPISRGKKKQFIEAYLKYMGGG